MSSSAPITRLDVQSAAERPIRVLHLRDSPWVDGPGRTILETGSHLDRSRVEYHIGVLIAQREGEHPLVDAASQRGISVIPIDTFNLLRMVISDPSRFGFSNATSTACDLTQVQSSLICNSSNYPAGSDESSVFADGNHPTTATQRLISEYVVGMLAAPQQVNALPTSAVATRAALHDLLRTQLFAGELQRQRDGTARPKQHRSRMYLAASPMRNQLALLVPLLAACAMDPEFPGGALPTLDDAPDSDGYVAISAGARCWKRFLSSANGRRFTCCRTRCEAESRGACPNTSRRSAPRMASSKIVTSPRRINRSDRTPVK